jgi:DNA-binding transcriptional MerR regulator
MTPDRDRTYDLEGLCQAAATLLAEGPMPEDQRVAAIPDGRTVRYYQSIGVVDRPLRYDGRTAVYGWRHLLQVVATKRLQTAGYTLAQVQQSLAGRVTEALEAAVLPSVPVPAPAPTPAPAEVGPVRPLVSAEVAPGVIVTVDPARVADANGIVSTIRQALLQKGGLP